ncbi:hypothetical protein ACHAXS_001237 [Conticribra weissflogii]
MSGLCGMGACNIREATGQTSSKMKTMTRKTSNCQCTIKLSKQCSGCGTGPVHKSISTQEIFHAVDVFDRRGGHCQQSATTCWGSAHLLLLCLLCPPMWNTLRSREEEPPSPVPSPCKAVLYYNIFSDGNMVNWSQYSGEKVESSNKYLMNVWFWDLLID